MGGKPALASKARSLTALVNHFRRNESGATAIEYSLLVALIFLAIVAAVRSYSSSTSVLYNEIDETIQER